MRNPHIHDLHLVRDCQGAILVVLPVVVSKHEVSAFQGSIYGLKWAVETSVSGCLVQFHSYGQQAPRLPIFALWTDRG